MINKHNKKGQPHGYWERYRNNGSLYYKCNYVNGILVGYEEWDGIDGTIEKIYHIR